MSDIYEIRKPEELLITGNVIDSPIHLSVEDAGIILGYLEGHDYMLTLESGQLMRVDLAEENGERVAYTLDEVIDLVCEWNYELLEEAQAVMENPKDFAQYCEYKFSYDVLKADETALDKMFVQTIYGCRTEQLAQKMIVQAGGKLPEKAATLENNRYPEKTWEPEEGRKR